MKKYKNLIIILLVIALLIGADAIIMKKVISNKQPEEKPAETISETVPEKTSEPYWEDYKDETEKEDDDEKDKEEYDKYYNMDIEHFLTEYWAKQKSGNKNHIIENVAENRVGTVLVNNDGTGLAEGDISAGAGHVYGKLLKTTDGGKTWKIIKNSINLGKFVYFDDSIIQFRYVTYGYCSEVNLFDGSGNEKENINLSDIFGMSAGDREYSFDVVADVIECREHSVVVGWRLSEGFSRNKISDYSGDYAGNYDSYVYIGEFDSEFNEIEQIYKNRELLDKIKN